MTDTNFATRIKRATGPRITANFGEAVTYYPKGGGSRSIMAKVVREGLELIDGAGVIGRADLFTVQNDSTTGISSDELNTGGDELGYPRRVNESAARHSIVKLVSDNGGLVRFGCA